MINLRESNLNLEETLNGAKLFEGNKVVPIFILPSRHDILKTTVNASRDLFALYDLFQKHSNQSTDGRGLLPKGIYKYYSSFGIHCNINSPGLHAKCIKESLHRQENQLKQMISRAERCAKMYLPFGLLSFLKKCKELCDSSEIYSLKHVTNDSSMISPTSQYSSIWSSAAASCNYVSPSHTDDDCFICCLMVSHSLQIRIQKK